MIQANTIKAVVYDPQEITPIVQKFLNIPEVMLFTYTDEDQFNTIINKFRMQYKSKEIVLFKKFMGRIFQMCPGTPKMICCNYRLINTGFNCLYNCAYCYLQIYLNSFGIQLFSNMDELYKHIDPFFDEMVPGMIYRIGTGEFTDSLMIDELTGIGAHLIDLFAKHPSIMLELKTKSDNVEHLLNIKNKGNAVIGWSVNSSRNCDLYEEGAATLDERINAAARAARAGYYVAFHFDPVILYDNWKADYQNVVKVIFEKVPEKSVVWISMGGFRYQNPFVETVRKNFPHEQMSTGEFFPGEDMKYRYLWQQRVEVYQTLRNAITEFTDHPYLYMCMESNHMWEVVFDKKFTCPEDLEDDFSSHLYQMLKNENRLQIK
ncbi:MAG: hypothetical protein PF637_11660 [Spirochaetes bacterium]|jgi:spore photoproduct lyase|nr:hypothetical protein [Spirochaetota bacterium]